MDILVGMFGKPISNEIVTITRTPKVTKDKQFFRVKGIFVNKEPTYAGWDEQVIIEGEYDLKTFQDLQPGSVIRVSGPYTPPPIHDAYGLLLAESITPCELPEVIEDHGAGGLSTTNPYMTWRNRSLGAWMNMNPMVDKFLCKYPEHFDLESQPVGDAWLKLSDEINRVNPVKNNFVAGEFIAPIGLVDAQVGREVRSKFFRFLEDNDRKIILRRPGPDLLAVEIEP